MREQIADIIADKVSGPVVQDWDIQQAHREDQLTAADAIIAALSGSAPPEAGWETLWRAAQALVDRLDFVHAHEAYRAVWEGNQMRNGFYAGPIYEEHLNDLRAALSPVPDAGAGARYLPGERCNCGLPKGSDAEGEHHEFCLFKGDAGAGDGVPAGMVMVPREPTEAMVRAGGSFLDSDQYALARPASTTTVSFWIAMLSAYPATPEAETPHA